MTRSRCLLLLFLLFFIPIVLSWVAYRTGYHFGKSTTSHGQLIIPPFPVDMLPIYNAQGQPFKNNQKWQIIFLYMKDCRTECQRGLYYLHQIRQATGADRERIERILLTNRSPITDPFNTQHFFINPKSFAKTMQKYLHTSPRSGSVFIIDPHGNVMMVYPPNSDPNGIFKDMQHLLKVSQIG